MTDARSYATTLPDQLVDFERSIGRRNRREWIGCIVVCTSFVLVALAEPGTLHRLSGLEIAAAAGYIAWHLHREGRVEIPADEREPEDQLRRAMVRELLRQSRLLDSALRWYVGPLALGWYGLQVASWMSHGVRTFAVVYLVGGTVLGALIVFANKRAAGRLRERAAAIEDDASPTPRVRNVTSRG